MVDAVDTAAIDTAVDTAVIDTAVDTAVAVVDTVAPEERLERTLLARADVAEAGARSSILS